MRGPHPQSCAILPLNAQTGGLILRNSQSEPRTFVGEPMASETSAFAPHWDLDPDCIYLNHGSFGACPRPVLQAQQRLRDRMESQPVRFLFREFEERWDKARCELAAFVNCDPSDLVAVPNATVGVNTVLRSLKLRKDDEILVTNHEYNACRNAVDAVAAQAGATVVIAPIPFPLQSADEALQAIFAGLSSRTRLVLVDHVTSQTALVLPVARLIWELKKHHIETLVDGAHAPGMVPVDLRALGAAYYAGNCHKWLCAPKGAGFLFVRRDQQEEVHPLAISHGANSTRSDRSRFQLEFAWTGTFDPTPFLCVPDAIAFLGGLFPGGWPELMRANRLLAVQARKALCDALGVAPPCPEALLGSMAAVPLPDSRSEPPAPPLYCDPIQEELLRRFKIEVPVIPWPHHPHRLLRLSAQVYNTKVQYSVLADAVKAIT